MNYNLSKIENDWRNPYVDDSDSDGVILQAMCYAQGEVTIYGAIDTKRNKVYDEPYEVLSGLSRERICEITDGWYHWLVQLEERIPFGGQITRMNMAKTGFETITF